MVWAWWCVMKGFLSMWAGVVRFGGLPEVCAFQIAPTWNTSLLCTKKQEQHRTTQPTFGVVYSYVGGRISRQDLCNAFVVVLLAVCCRCSPAWHHRLKEWCDAAVARPDVSRLP